MKIAVARWIKLPNLVIPLGIPTTTISIQADASLRGYGFLINQRSYYGTFDQSMRTYSINVLELMTVWMVTLMIQEKNQALEIRSDNSATVAAIRRGNSGVFHLSALAEIIWKRAASMNWSISVAHIGGTFNVLADQLSRDQLISTEWSIPKQLFREQILIHEPSLQVDLFATSLNHKLKKYVSPCLSCIFMHE